LELCLNSFLAGAAKYGTSGGCVDSSESPANNGSPDFAGKAGQSAWRAFSGELVDRRFLIRELVLNPA
jgi:hypothetical protein